MSKRKLDLVPIDRRCALSGIASTVLVACYGDSSTGTDADTDAATDGPDETASDVVDCSGTTGTMVGAETAFAVGTWTLVGQTSSSPYIVSQDASGFFAFTAICTHQGCTVDAPASDGSTFCPCHGSRFNGNGSVTGGPAFRPLQHYAVNVCGGNVYVDSNTPVSASARTPAQ